MRKDILEDYIGLNVKLVRTGGLIARGKLLRIEAGYAVIDDVYDGETTISCSDITSVSGWDGRK